MHDMLTAAATSDPIKEWEHRLRDAQQQSLADRTLFDRELFYAIQPKDRLTTLINRYRESFE